MFALCTETLAFVLQELNPTVSRTSRPKTPLVRSAPARRALASPLISI
jgi:hypothetical protein